MRQPRRLPFPAPARQRSARAGAPSAARFSNTNEAVVPSGTTLFIWLSSLMKAAAIAVSSCGGKHSRAGRTRQIDGKARPPSQLPLRSEPPAVLLRAGRLGWTKARLRLQGPSAPWLSSRGRAAARFGAHWPLCDATTPCRRAEAVAYAESARLDPQPRARVDRAQGQASRNS